MFAYHAIIVLTETLIHVCYANNKESLVSVTAPGSTPITIVCSFSFMQHHDIMHHLIHKILSNENYSK
jgi:hypothetical protein